MDKLLLKNVLAEFPGKMVTINDHKIHIYTEGKGTPSLVFLSGGGTFSPMYYFKTLFSKMSNEYQIAVVEKAGYGFSEISNVSTDIDTILSETRAALNEANIEPPYILFPHSMSGIEALYWVKCYPDEVKAIIGLDPALPPAYEKMKLDSIIKTLKFISKIINGKLKFLLPIIANLLPPIKYGLLNKSDKNVFRALIYHRMLTNDMINECLMIKENAKKINIESLRKIPMLFFISNGKGTGMKKNEWEKLIRDYTKELNVEIVPFNAGHYLHNILPEEISNKSKIFIKKLE
jgi:pimeloyl-ACP methyl ester carboxylesterase